MRTEPNKIERPRNKSVVVHPDNVGGKLIGNLGTIGRRGEDVTAANVDLVGKRNSDGVAAFGAFDNTVTGHDPVDTRGPTGSRFLDGAVMLSP